MSSGANGKRRQARQKVGVLMAQEVLNDKMTFEQRPEWGGKALKWVVSQSEL